MTIKVSEVQALIHEYESHKTPFQLQFSIQYSSDVKLVKRIILRYRNSEDTLSNLHINAIRNIYRDRKERRGFFLNKTLGDIFFEQLEILIANHLIESFEVKKEKMIHPRPIPHEHLKKFNEVLRLEDGFNLNTVSFNEKKLKKSLWATKEMTLELALIESISAEIFRLFVGKAQPEGRIYFQEDYTPSSKPYVVSKIIDGFASQEKVVDLLDFIIMEDTLSSRNKTALSQYATILVASIFLEENDLHIGNLAIDKDKNIIKYDYGYCLNGFYNEYMKEPKETINSDYRFNEYDFLSLPQCGKSVRGSYKPYNFLDSLIKLQTLDTLILNKEIIRHYNIITL